MPKVRCAPDIFGPEVLHGLWDYTARDAGYISYTRSSRASRYPPLGICDRSNNCPAGCGGSYRPVPRARWHQQIGRHNRKWGRSHAPPLPLRYAHDPCNTGHHDQNRSGDPCSNDSADNPPNNCSSDNDLNSHAHTNSHYNRPLTYSNSRTDISHHAFCNSGATATTNEFVYQQYPGCTLYRPFGAGSAGTFAD